MASILKVVGQPLTPSGTPGQPKDSPSRVSSPPFIREWKDPKNPTQKLSGASSLARDLQSLSDKINSIITTLSTATPNITQILIVDQQTGAVISAVGNLTYKGVVYTNWFSELHAGDFLLTNDPTKAVFNVNLDGSVSIGDNGWIDVHDPFDGNAAWIGTQYDSLAITGAADNGAGLIRLHVPNHNLATGNAGVHVLNMQFAGVPNATGVWTVTVVDSSHVDLQNSVFAGSFVAPPEVGGIPSQMPVIDNVLQVTGAVSNSGLIRLKFGVATGYESGTEVNVQGVGGVPNATGQWITSIPATLAITGAVNNGSGLIRLTAVGHNFSTGDFPQVIGVGGVPNADGYWHVTVIDATHIDLQGSTFIGTYTSGGTITFLNANIIDLAENAQTGAPSVFAGSYTSGGTCLEYYAGILAETIAVGPSFQNYKLRAFPSGDLRINNADISLTSATGQIVLDPNTTQIRLTNFTNLSEIVLDATVPSLTFYDQTGTPDVTLEILQESPLPVSSATNASPVVIHVPGSSGTVGPPAVASYVNGDTVLIQGASGNTVINGYRIVENYNAIAETFTMTDLAGNVINGNGVFAGTTTCTRYYAGLLAQSLALGANWSGYRLRFFADGTLKLNRASIDQSTITNSTIQGGLVSVGGTAPNQITLTIANGTLVIVGTGTQAGLGTITIDGLLTAGYLSLAGKSSAPTAPGAGFADIYYDDVLGGLYYNLAGAGWLPLNSAGASGAFSPLLVFAVPGTAPVYAVNAGVWWSDAGGMVFGTIEISLTSKGTGTGALTISGLPSTAGAQWECSIEATGMSLLTGALSANVQAGAGVIRLNQWSATGVTALTDTSLTNTSSFIVSFQYHP